MKIYVKKLQKLGNVRPQQMRHNTRHVPSSGQALTIVAKRVTWPGWQCSIMGPS